jgi:cephalosporin hydroxylase
MWQYQDILYRLRPDLVIETGTADGGSALFLAQMMDLVGYGRLVTVDISHPRESLPEHDRIKYLTGSSTDPEVLDELKREADAEATVLVILDSDHSASHVRAELETYQHFVTPGSYMIVEDSNVNGHPVGPRFGPGPMEAIDAFLATSAPFSVDDTRERYLMTQNPRGYLLRTEG